MGIDRAEFVRAAVAVPICAAAVRLIGLARLQRWIDRRASSAADAGAASTDADLRRAATALAQVRDRSPRPGACLSRALALQWLLARRGHRTQLRIGARRTADGVAAHAWVEHEGRVLNDRPDIAGEYRPLEQVR